MTRNSLSKRAGPLFGAWLLVVGMVMAVSPAIPRVSALDPTPDPGATPIVSAAPDPTPDPTPAPTPDPTPDPTAAPTPDPTPAPTAEPTTGPSPEPTPEPTPAPTADPSADPSAEPSAAPSGDPGASASPEPSTPPDTGAGLRVEHYWIDQENEAGTVTSTGRLDDPRINVTRFVVYRIRFQVLNTGAEEVRIRPAILAGAGTDPASWTALPAADIVPGKSFYAASDRGGVSEVRTQVIDAGSLRLAASSDPDATAVDGLFSAGRNPAPGLVLAAGTFTEIEFAVRATVDADWKSAYSFRLDLDAPTAFRVDAPLSLGAAPPVDLSPGQQSGDPVGRPVPLYRLATPRSGSTATGLAATPAVSGMLAAFDAPVEAQALSPHVQYSLREDSCAACHSAHRSPDDRVLLQEAAPTAGICFRCHDGTGASADIQSQFEDPAIPANDPSTASYYAHPATDSTGHTLDELEEFAGVSNRHAECADCHQPHLADATPPVATTGGWTVGGAIKGASGVAVTNGAANTTPAFTWQRTNKFEYELCFKCHSGYTTLPSRDEGFPSRYALDKSVEFNPANRSYHPVEAAGTNGTSAMNANLAGTSPYKLWNFTASSVVRCQNCHGPSTAVSPAVDGQIDNHASANRGILIRSYRDRVVNGRNTPYAAADFALCYVCHAEAPYRDTSGNQRADTNFRLHGLHVSGLQGEGSGTAGTSIDVDGAGAGNATCAECHFRIHGSSFPANGSNPNSRLVNFAPNVQTLQGGIDFVPRDGSTPGSCALRCHARNHEGLDY